MRGGYDAVAEGDLRRGVLRGSKPPDHRPQRSSLRSRLGEDRMSPHLRRVIDALEHHGCRPRHVRGDEYRAHCPGPLHRRRDLRPSLGVTGLPDKVLLNCFVCRRGGLPEILKALDLILSDLFAASSVPVQAPRRERRRRVKTYRYEDIDGRLLAEKHRYEPKTFRWRSPLAGGGFSWTKSNGVTLYRWPDLVDMFRVLVVEGEKAVDRLVSLGFAATCPPTGSNVWIEDYTDALWRAGARVAVVIADNDPPGLKHAHRVVRACHGFRPDFAELSIEPEAPWAEWPSAEPGDDEVQPLRAKLLELPDIPHRADVYDWLEAGHTADELRTLVEAAPALDAIRQAKADRKRLLDRERQRRHREKLRAAGGMA